jgi:hypothetical protein
MPLLLIEFKETILRALRSILPNKKGKENDDDRRKFDGGE